MALTLGNPNSISTGARNAQADAFDTYVNAATDQFLELLDGSNVTLVSFDLDATNAFGSASSGAISVTGQPLQATAVAGSASSVASWRIRTTTPNENAMTGPVTGSDTITSGQTVNLTSFSLTWPAS